jgi:hypothetical protein
VLRHIGLPELLVVLVVGLLFVPAIFFLISLQRALERCAPESRAMSPGAVWLSLIPLFNFVWQFVVVINVAESLRNEFVRRNMPMPEAAPGKMVGLAMCIFTIASLVPPIGVVTSVAGVVCWVGEYSRMLGAPSGVALIV